MNRPLPLLRTNDSAVAYVDHQQSVTYATLKEQVLARAEELRAAGLLPGSRIAFCPATDLPTLVNFWAIWHCQANACPIR